MTPGPIVEETLIDLRYRPLADAGLARLISSSTDEEVLDQRVGVEADLAERDVDVAEPVGAVLDLARP